MEVTELNLIGDFEAGIKCLQQNPSLLAKISSIDKIPHLYFSFWTWGALMFAIFATFTNFFNRLKLFAYHHLLLKVLSCFRRTCQTQQIFDEDDYDFDFDFSDEEDTPSSVADSDDQDLYSDEEGIDKNEIFRAEGSSFWENNEGSDSNFTLRRRNGFSWSDFSAGKSVVQLWDSFGLGLNFEDDDYENEISISDLDRDGKISSGRQGKVAEKNFVLTAEMDGNNGTVGLGTFDYRVAGNSPEIYAAWRPCQRKLWSDDDGGEKDE